MEPRRVRQGLTGAVLLASWIRCERLTATTLRPGVPTIQRPRWIPPDIAGRRRHGRFPRFRYKRRARQRSILDRTRHQPFARRHRRRRLARPVIVIATAATIVSLLGLAQSGGPLYDFVAMPRPAAHVLDPFLADLEDRTFRFFWDTANPKNGLIPDRYPTPSFEHRGGWFGLTAYPIGVERGYVTREDGPGSASLATLRFFAMLRRPKAYTVGRVQGLFLSLPRHEDRASASRRRSCRPSTRRSFLAGALFCQCVLRQRATSDEARNPRAGRLDLSPRRLELGPARIRRRSRSAGRRTAGFSIRLARLQRGHAAVCARAGLADASRRRRRRGPSGPAPTTNAGARTTGRTYLAFPPLFGHQYSHVWIDFRGIQDDYMRAHGIDYFENSRRAVYAQRRYADRRSSALRGLWLRRSGASPRAMGPPTSTIVANGRVASIPRVTRPAARPHARHDDCTLAPTGDRWHRLPFAPEIAIPAVLDMNRRYGEYIFSTYGFVDAFNPSFHPTFRSPGHDIPRLDGSTRIISASMKGRSAP